MHWEMEGKKKTETKSCQTQKNMTVFYTDILIAIGSANNAYSQREIAVSDT